jgi:hypothetical protein
VARLAALAAVVVAAVSGCNTGFIDKTMPYVGTWMITSGTDTAQCLSGTTTSPVSGSVIVSFGAGTVQLSVRDTNHGTCLWHLNVHPTNATFRDGPTCAATVPQGVAKVTPVDYTMTLQANNMATVTSDFDWTILGDTCRHVQQETLLLMNLQPNLQ